MDMQMASVWKIKLEDTLEVVARRASSIGFFINI